MNIEQARFNMIEQQIRPWDVLDEGILELLTIVRRENFVPEAYKNLAFMDIEIPLPGGENMLAPKVEARILQAVAAKKHEQVLEIGTGSGFMAALLAHKARHVTSIEMLPELKTQAEKNLFANDVTNVTVHLGNGAQGWTGSGTQSAPYDVIVISGSLPILPDVFLEQIKVGGRLAVFLGDAPLMTANIITRLSETEYNTATLFETNIKPLRNAVTPSHFKF